MGEYFCWVNVERKEYIDPCDFDYGCKAFESSSKNSEVLKALRNLLSNEWKCSKIIWMGDECRFPKKIDDEILYIMLKHCDDAGFHDDMFATMCESYKNISGLFRASEKVVRKEIGFDIEDKNNGIDPINYYRVDFKEPYKGLFERDGISTKYIINHTKRIAYSYEQTKMLYQDGSENVFSDPLPMLLGFGRTLDLGEWLGDVIEASDELPEGTIVLDTIILWR